jgi:predicted transcriptional regulator
MATTISFRTDEHIKALLEAFTRKKHLSKTRVINEALLEYLKSADEKITRQVEILKMIDEDNDYLSEEI